MCRSVQKACLQAFAGPRGHVVVKLHVFAVILLEFSISEGLAQPNLHYFGPLVHSPKTARAELAQRPGNHLCAIHPRDYGVRVAVTTSELTPN